MARSEDLIMMTPAQLRALTTRELRAVTQQLADAANKRIKRLLADEVGRTSPLFARAQWEGKTPYYSVKGKTKRGEIMAEYKRLRNVLRPGAKTTSLKEWKKTSNDIYRKLGMRPTPAMWEAYRRLESVHGGQFPKGYGSEDVQRLLVKVQQNGYHSADDLYKWVEMALTEAYEHGQFSDDDGEDPFDFEDFYNI